MKVQIYITITDSSSEEDVKRAGYSVDSVRNLYKKAFSNIIRATVAEGAEADVIVTVTDNTREGTEQ